MQLNYSRTQSLYRVYNRQHCYCFLVQIYNYMYACLIWNLINSALKKIFSHYGMYLYTCAY